MASGGALKAEPGAEVSKPLFKGRGIVKAVLSGDSIVIQDDKPAAQGPPQERTLTLSSLSAPRLARPPETKDEVYIILPLFLIISSDLKCCFPSFFSFL